MVITKHVHHFEIDSEKYPEGFILEGSTTDSASPETKIESVAKGPTSALDSEAAAAIGDDDVVIFVDKVLEADNDIEIIAAPPAKKARHK